MNLIEIHRDPISGSVVTGKISPNGERKVMLGIILVPIMIYTFQQQFDGIGFI
jgi:hypothetical protein